MQEYAKRGGALRQAPLAGLVFLGLLGQAHAQEVRRPIRWGTPPQVYVAASSVVDDPLAPLYVWTDQRRLVAPDALNVGSDGLLVAVMGSPVLLPSESYRGPIDRDELPASVVRVMQPAPVYASPVGAPGELPLGMVLPGQRYLSEAQVPGASMLDQVVGQLLQKLLDGLLNPAGSQGQLTPEERGQLRDAVRENPGIADVFGTPVAGGWDRDGDGRPDLEDTDRDGLPDTWGGGGASPNVLPRPSGDAATAAAMPTASDPIGRQEAGGGTTTTVLGQPSARSPDQETSAERDLQEGSEAPEEEAAPAEEREQKWETLRGRVVLVPRLRPGEGHAAAEDPAWGDEWRDGAQAAPRPAQERVTLSEQLTRVEAAIAAWRAAEAERLASPPARSAAEVAGGASRRAPRIDPLRHTVWLVAEESWREGELPVRIRLSLPDDDQIELVDGAYAVLQGKPDVLRADARLIRGYSGEVRAFDLRKVILSSPTPPALATPTVDNGPARGAVPAGPDEDEELARLREALGGE